MLRRYDIHFEALKESAFFCINFKTSINKMTRVTGPKNKRMDIKEFKPSLPSTSFLQATSPHFIMALS